MAVQGQSNPKENQITVNKSNVERSSNILSGYIAGSMNGGINRVMGYKQVMAGEKHKEMRFRTRIKLLTPLTPAYQNLKIQLQTFFVPNSRVWDNAEEFTAQRGGTTETKIQEIPNLGGKMMKKSYAKNPSIPSQDAQQVNYSDTQTYRDTFIGWYIPRINPNEFNQVNDIVFPKISVLPLRGYKAIYNDFLRNKEYDEPIFEFKGDTVSNEEWESFFATSESGLNANQLYGRAKRNSSYYTDYRTDMQGWEIDKPNDTNNELLTWMAWESKADMVRNSAEFAQMNTWEIIAKLRGSKLLSEGKTQLLSSRVHTLNYSSVTQTTYNNNEDIQEKFRVMGQQGAYSFTEIDIPLYAGHEFNEEGYIHIIGTVYADTVFESGINRLELNVNAFDRYRPDLKDDKLDTIYISEFGTSEFEVSPSTENSYYQAVGFKRKFSEYFYLNNLVSGDLLTTRWLTNQEFSYDGGLPASTTEYLMTTAQETQSTYQFFDLGGKVSRTNNEYRPKKIWLDYTDFLLNKNQVIPNGLIRYGYDFFVSGENQIDYVGYLELIADMPISEDIAMNYTKWGEH